MRIVITGAVDFPDGGGASRCIHMLAKGMAARGHSVTVLIPCAMRPGAKTLKMDGFTVRWCCAHSLRRKGLRWLSTWIISRTLSVHTLLLMSLRREYDLLLLYGPAIEFTVVSLLARLRGRKVAFQQGDFPDFTRGQSVRERARAASARITDRILARSVDLVIIAGSNLLEERFHRLAPKTRRIRIVPPIDADFFGKGDGDRARMKWHMQGNRLVVYCGNVSKLEGVDKLVEAMAIVAGKHPDARLLIAGPCLSGELELAGLCRRLGIQDRVVHLGIISIQEVADLLAAADVCVMPKIDCIQNRVAAPIKIGEYLASGRPVVASNICEIDLYLTHGTNAMLCEPSNVRQLSENISTVLSDKAVAERLARNGPTVAKELFDILPNTARILNALEAPAAGPNKRK